MTRKINVLALSGGGYRGLFTAQVLAEIERATKRPITDHFDLITGTSIGGIIALAIADGHRPAELVEIFKEKGPIIFPKPKRWPIPLLKDLPATLWSLKALNRSLYDGKGLKSVLDELFGDKQLQDLKEAFVMVPAARASTGKPKFFKTPHSDEFYADLEIPVVDAALATSAAPVYFPMHNVAYDSTRYLDGGLVGNAPGMFGYIEAITRLGAKPEDVNVLSVGTLSGKPCVSENTSRRPWLPYWLNPIKPRLLELIFSVQEHQTHNMLSILLKDRYCIIDTTVSQESANDIDLDNTSQAAQAALLSRANEEAALFTNTSFFKNIISYQEGSNDQPQ